MRTVSKLTLVLVLTLVCCGIQHAGPRDAQWKEVTDAMNKGLPKTAIEKLEPIIEAALKEKAYAEAIKAISQKIALEGTIQGNKPEERITRMQAAIAEAPEDMVPVMDAILANWYWHYFQQNRWRFMQRSQTAEPPGDDFTTWDLKRILAEIDQQFTKALAAEDVLKKTAVAEYDELLVKGNMPDAYRPTMFDVLAHNALQFYTSAEQAGAQAQDAFDLMANSPIFSSVADFTGWEVNTTDDTSLTVRAIRLYQNLLKFHKDDDDRSALIDADLHRLQFGYNKAFGEEKNSRYKAALKQFVADWGDHQISARAYHAWGSVLHSEDDFVEARNVALRGKNAFPDSPGGKMCANLIAQIEAKSSNVSVERVWNEPLPKIHVRYRNVTNIYFRAVADDYEKRLAANAYRPEYLNQAERQALLAKEPVRTWSAELPATDDYQERLEEIAAPEDMSPGFYFLIASHREDFADSNNVVSFTDFWVSDLALVVRNERGEGSISGFVLNAISGEPLAGAEVRSWLRTRNNRRSAGPTVKTDKNGLFSIALAQNQGYLLLAKHGEHQLASANDFYNYRQDLDPRPFTRTIFFTDRSLYRPGQTIHYKGICIDVNQNNDNYKTLAGQNVTIVFQDRNGKEIERHTTRSNDYGSISGSFTAPRDRLMGRMSIRVDGNPPGAASFNVEEYKRPKFQVVLDKPTEAAKLHSEVTMRGTATAYTGAAINGAKVRYRVVREVRYPPWWGWYYWWRTPQSNSQEIAHGNATTGGDGSFEIKFTAKPDLSVSEDDEPVFHFRVYADVTDTTGETRSDDETIRVGYTALQATLSADEWLTDDKEVEIKISTTTLDGEGQAAEGTLKIYRLRQPKVVERPTLSGHPAVPFRARGGVAAPRPDPGNILSWPEGPVAAEHAFSTDADGNATFSVKLDAGPYRAVLETNDRFGKPVSARLPMEVLDPDAKKMMLRVPFKVAAPRWTLEPGQEFMALWGSGYDQARAFVEIEHRRKIVNSFWTDSAITQLQIKQAVDESMRGGFTLRVTMVRENRAHLMSRKIDVPWSNKELTIQWEHFVSKLEPAAKETWTAIINGPDAKHAVAELVAGMYDASLDAYLPHQWQSSFNVFRQDHSNLYSQFENQMKHLQHLRGRWNRSYHSVQINYRDFPPEIVANIWGYGFLGRAAKRGGVAMPMAAPATANRRMATAEGVEMQNAAVDRLALADADKQSAGQLRKSENGAAAPEGPDLSKVSARKNLDETAFFFPHLISGEDGQVKLEFTMPEALTEWKFLGFAHDRDLRSGLLQDKVVTAKDLMIQPNPPRFLREGDELEFTVKVSNQSPTRQTGTVRLTFADARTGDSVDAQLSNTVTDLEFEIASKESKSYSWRLKVPDELGFLTYKAVGSTGRLSDGEEGYLPVLSRRILVTESLPLPIRGPETKEFEFTKLLNSGKSDSLKHQSLTVQVTSNPAWYAVLALPYLMEFPHECTEQTFNRLYANALARHIAGSDPKIRRIFDQWKGTPALDSPLEKNEDLKAVMLEETPWLRQAKKESQARRNVGILFDDNRLNQETERLIRKLAELQRPDGTWSWFPGGPKNDYITLYITTGFGRMRHLGVDIDVASAVKALGSLDNWIDERYQWILKHGDKDKNHLSPTIAFYLYGRSFFLQDKAIDAKHKPAVDYFLEQGKKFWLDLANRQSQAHLAIGLKRFGDLETAQGIMRSIKERSVTDEELGMFWRELELSWWWYRAPIETQAMMIEAFDEVMNDAEAVEECKVWLLKQKQTQDWKTTKATADAVYGLMLRGTNLLASDSLVEISLGDMKIEPENVEAGTGFYEERFVRREVEPEFGNITMKKVDEGVAWGSVHWQYLEDMSKVTPYEGTPLKMTKRLYTKEFTKSGPVLNAVEGPVQVGDELVTRVEIRVDRDMEYVHLKDYRGSGTEPVNVLSQYKYQDGLAYYESTRDTASHFFIDYLPKGVYVFEYSTRVVHRGEYQTGVASIQCMYAPEFNSHSESINLVVE